MVFGIRYFRYSRYSVLVFGTGTRLVFGISGIRYSYSINGDEKNQLPTYAHEEAGHLLVAFASPSTIPLAASSPSVSALYRNGQARMRRALILVELVL